VLSVVTYFYMLTAEEPVSLQCMVLEVTPLVLDRPLQDSPARPPTDAVINYYRICGGFFGF